MNSKILKAFLIILPVLALLSLIEIANMDEQRSDNNWLETGIELSDKPFKEKAIDLNNNKLEDISLRNGVNIAEF